jgi:hypothetical protein
VIQQRSQAEQTKKSELVSAARAHLEKINKVCVGVGGWVGCLLVCLLAAAAQVDCHMLCLPPPPCLLLLDACNSGQALLRPPRTH